MQFAVLLSYHAKVKGENKSYHNPTYPNLNPNPALFRSKLLGSNPILPYPNTTPNKPNPGLVQSQLLGSKPALKSYRWVGGGGAFGL